MPNQTQYQVSLDLPRDRHVRERALAALSAAGIDLARIVEEEQKDRRWLSMYVEDRKTAAQYRRLLRVCCPAQGKVCVRTHHRKDWESRWKKGWRPFSLTSRFQVIPLWQDERDCPGNKRPIFLETTNAFGTGLHETTRFTAQLIQDLAVRGISFLDVGTGTGILVIVASHCGAQRVEAIDIDPDAVSVARQNINVNGIKGCRLKVADIGVFSSRKPFDLVAANLVSPDLILFRDRLIRLVRPGGHLVVSGISLGNISRVRQAFVGSSLRFLRLRRGREWCAMVFVN